MLIALINAKGKAFAERKKFQYGAQFMLEETILLLKKLIEADDLHGGWRLYLEFSANKIREAVVAEVQDMIEIRDVLAAMSAARGGAWIGTELVATLEAAV
ncbi:unnamed protein product [Sphagnum jensenii]|uniref:Uncharacterized protein n=1 Tax=Sphagnum jensenii TaxID=128206 RepID=A0ABP0VA15_9BRYO